MRVVVGEGIGWELRMRLLPTVWLVAAMASEVVVLIGRHLQCPRCQRRRSLKVAPGWSKVVAGEQQSLVNEDRWRLESMAANECHNEPIDQSTSKKKEKRSGGVGYDSSGKARCGWWATQNSNKAMSLVARSGMRERRCFLSDRLLFSGGGK